MSYVRNAWYVAGWSTDLVGAAPLGVHILGERIVLYRGVDGRAIALEDRCVHRLAPLSLGRCEGDNLRCMYHGLLFDPNGTTIEIPGQDMVPNSARVRSYPVVERHSWIWVWMGDKQVADTDLIPPAVGFDDPDYILGHGTLDYEASAGLICDNLLDLSHLSYVHATSFGAGNQWADNQPTVMPLERGVRISRWMTAEPGPRTQTTEPLDRWQSYDFLIPGVLLMFSANYPLGTADRLAKGSPDPDDAISGITFTSQAVTPTKGATARYFFSWGPHVRSGDAALRDQLLEIAQAAFAEDRAIIEGQQRVIDDEPGRQVMPTKADKGVVLYNRLVARLSAEEAAVQV